MTRTDAEGRELRNLSELRHILHAQVDEVCDDIEWKRRMTHGVSRGEGSGPVTGGGPSDTTGQIAISRDGLRAKVSRAIRDLAWLVDHKMPEIQGRLELEDDRPLASDEEAGAYVHGGVSAYRGDRKAARSRPDIQEALDAQRRRIQRSERYGDA